MLNKHKNTVKDMAALQIRDKSWFLKTTPEAEHKNQQHI